MAARTPAAQKRHSAIETLLKARGDTDNAKLRKELGWTQGTFNVRMSSGLGPEALSKLEAMFDAVGVAVPEGLAEGARGVVQPKIKEAFAGYDGREASKRAFDRTTTMCSLRLGVLFTLPPKEFFPTDDEGLATELNGSTDSFFPALKAVWMRLKNDLVTRVDTVVCPSGLGYLCQVNATWRYLHEIGKHSSVALYLLDHKSCMQSPNQSLRVINNRYTQDIFHLPGQKARHGPWIESEDLSETRSLFIMSVAQRARNLQELREYKMRDTMAEAFESLHHAVGPDTQYGPIRTVDQFFRISDLLVSAARRGTYYPPLC
jgi:hypothetical protein